ncbi:hypothetical protein HYS91_05445 [Candidatus Daviesbacteria bacterium]|nr:hypothetical protein [Candidatus Daviesbacteria bacterium]
MSDIRWATLLEQHTDRRKALGAMLAGAAVSLLSACGGGTSEDTPAQTPIPIMTPVTIPISTNTPNRAAEARPEIKFVRDDEVWSVDMRAWDGGIHGRCIYILKAGALAKNNYPTEITPGAVQLETTFDNRDPRFLVVSQYVYRPGGRGNADGIMFPEQIDPNRPQILYSQWEDLKLFVVTFNHIVKWYAPIPPPRLPITPAAF